MLYSQRYGFVFLHIPKCAGVTVLRTLGDVAATPLESLEADCPEMLASDGTRWSDEIVQHPELGPIHLAHLPLPTMQVHFPKTLAMVRASECFSIVREPRSRFISALMQRLREFEGYGVTEVTEDDLRREARNVVAWLDGREAFADLPYIHFTRQTDYLDLDGERVVSEIFPIGNLDALWDWMRTRFGLQGLIVQRANSSLQPKPALKLLLRYVGPAYRTAVSKPLRDRVFALTQRAGLMENASSGYSHIDLGSDVERFIADYYARDSQVHEQACVRWSPKPAPRDGGERQVSL